MNHQQPDDLRNKRVEVVEDGAVVGWYCWTRRAGGALVRVFVPA